MDGKLIWCKCFDILLVTLILLPALLYSAFGVIIEKTRGAEDDLNTVAAGTMTGMLYKCAGRLAKILMLYMSLRMISIFEKIK